MCRERLKKIVMYRTRKKCRAVSPLNMSFLTMCPFSSMALCTSSSNRSSDVGMSTGVTTLRYRYRCSSASCIVEIKDTHDYCYCYIIEKHMVSYCH